jgi:hypothetical protein
VTSSGIFRRIYCFTFAYGRVRRKEYAYCERLSDSLSVRVPWISKYGPAGILKLSRRDTRRSWLDIFISLHAPGTGGAVGNKKGAYVYQMIFGN